MSFGVRTMPNGFINVPDWFAWENAGGGIAVGDMTGNGLQDLVVLMVDDPPGKNRGLYRVGRNLDTAGKPTAGWGPWIDIPDWFSFENQGAGLALWDLTGNGRLDLVVFMIDAPQDRIRRGIESADRWTPTATSRVAGATGFKFLTGSLGEPAWRDCAQ